ncbi:MAG: DUF1801 domain-containing protein [Planctomycetota bacterium]
MTQNNAEIDRYIAGFPEPVRGRLEELRATIHKAAPGATEAIKYGIPTFVLHENLVHFAGYQKHIGFYPSPSGIEHFAKELAAYPGAKGSVQFPHDGKLPLTLVSKIVKFRKAEAEAKAATKRPKK